jgi:hypothetical protein
MSPTIRDLSQGFGFGPVWAGDDFEIMAVFGVFPVDTSTAVVVVDLAGEASGWVGPVIETFGFDAGVGGVELDVADQEREVLRGDLAVWPVCMVERDAVAHVDHKEHVGEVMGLVESEDLDEVRGAAVFIRTPDNRVI